MSFALYRPRTFEEAFDLLDREAERPVLPLAGGTDLLLAMEFGRQNPSGLLSLSRLPLDTLEVRPDEIVVGATLPLRTLERRPEVEARLPGLLEAVREVGSVQLRHRATMGGNLVRAAPASDLLPPLLSLSARVVLRSREGRRELPVEQFLRASWTTELRRGELLEAVRIPAPRAGAYRWQRVRPANAISQVGVAVALHPSSSGSPWRVAAGGTEPTASRLVRTEAELPAVDPSEAEIEAACARAAEEASFRADLRAGEDYRRHLLKVLLRRTLEATRERSRRLPLERP
jgi:CO/xanthine dehydrogenase FAD-binding subunit